MSDRGTSKDIVQRVIHGSVPAIILDDGPRVDPRTLANRAQAYDDKPLGAVPDAALLQPCEFSHLDRANLIRTAKAIEELNQVFKRTATIEVSSTAIGILDGLRKVITDLSKKVDKLDATLRKMAPEPMRTADDRRQSDHDPPVEGVTTLGGVDRPGKEMVKT